MNISRKGAKTQGKAQSFCSFLLCVFLCAFAPLRENLSYKHVAQTPNKKLAAEVKAEFLHAWNGYKQYAWGHDDLKPLSKGFKDWYAEPLLMSPVDALDTMVVMG